MFRRVLAKDSMKRILILVIGRAKRAPHWGVQSIFRVIYVVGMSYVVCLSYVKLTA